MSLVVAAFSQSPQIRQLVAYRIGTTRSWPSNLRRSYGDGRCTSPPPQVDLPCRACSKGIDPWFEPKIANRCALCISQLQECRAPLWDFRHFRRACRTVSPAQWLDIHGQVSTHTCMTITVILSYPSIVAKQGMQRVHASLCAGRVWCSALHDLRLENGLLRHFILKPNICQDRLGTNAGES